MKLAFGKLWLYAAWFVVYAIAAQAFALWAAFGHAWPETEFQWRYFTAILIITLPGAVALTYATTRRDTKKPRSPQQLRLDL